MNYIFVVCEKTTDNVDEVAEETTPCVQNDLPGSVQEEQDCVSDGCNKYSNTNNNYFINNHLSSIEDVMDQAKTYELDGLSKKNYETAIEVMFNSESISVAVKSFLAKLFVRD